MENPIVFISHASGDYRDINGNVIPGNAISEIIQILDSNNIKRWIDEDGLISAKGWCNQIKEAIDSCNIFLYVSSEKANKSVNTANEIQYAIDKKKIIIPFKIDESEYHKDIYLNLILIHFLRYYEDRAKALQDLVSTIKNINIQIYPTVKVNHIPDEVLIKGKRLSGQLPSIFNTDDFSVSVSKFRNLEKLLDCESEKGCNSFNEYLDRLERLSEEHNYNVRQARIANVISDIKESKATSERCVCILFILLKMFLYYKLNDVKETIIIQKELDDVKFKLSFLEKNAQTINDATNTVVRGGMFLAGVAAMFTGKGGALARGTVHASTRGESIKVVNTQEIEARKLIFETFKKAAKSLIFEMA